MNLPFISGSFAQSTHLKILCSSQFEDFDVSHGHKDCVAVEADTVEESEGVIVREKKNLVEEMFSTFKENLIFSKTSLFIRYNRI